MLEIDELDDLHLLVNGVEILMLAFRPVGVYLHFTLRTAAMAQCVENNMYRAGTRKPAAMAEYVENQHG